MLRECSGSSRYELRCQNHQSSRRSNTSLAILAFGTNGDRPVAADYDGDGRADIAVFRPSTGIWYLLRSTAGFAGYQFGISTDTAVPGALIP